MNIVLVEPQIPPNTGNIARLCAAIRAPLHLVGDLGFKLSDRYLKRAGLDYWDLVELHIHSSAEMFFDSVHEGKLHFFSKKAPLLYTAVKYCPDDYLVFGSETKGLPESIFLKYQKRFRTIPIYEKQVRSLNLSSAVAIVTYEALRQNGFSGDSLDTQRGALCL